MNFQSEVLDLSHQLPVVVDFWAPWCGPCRYLGPILDELAIENSEVWKLVKVNVDENQDISQRYNIRGIPAVKLFIKGEVAAEFSGALPKNQITEWLDQHLPSEEKEAWSEIHALLSSDEDDSVKIDALKNYLKASPSHDEAKFELAKRLVLSAPIHAKELLHTITDRDSYYDELQNINIIIDFLGEQFTNDVSIEALLSDVQEELRSENFDDAVEKIIEAVQIDKHYKDDQPRKIGIALFNFLGRTHITTQNYRRRFDMMLY